MSLALLLGRIRQFLAGGADRGAPWLQDSHTTRRRFARAASILVCTLSACTEPDPPLRELALDGNRVSVSGISAGAYMAHQVHIAFSHTVDGAALLAGGPYACAGGNLQTALSQCMAPEATRPDATALAEVARERAAARQIDSVDGLVGDHVYVVHGRNDPLVSAAVTAATVKLYRALSPELEAVVDDTREFGHVFPLAQAGDCLADDTHMAPCGFDFAGELFRQLVDPQLVPATAAKGELIAFDQAPFGAEDADPVLAERGYLYLPPQCRSQQCGLHIAFHGCEMQADRIGTRFVADGGYNRWADQANVAVLYPQVRSSMMPLNPKACWDWWGYTGTNYDTRDGAQMRWLTRVLARLGITL